MKEFIPNVESLLTLPIGVSCKVVMRQDSEEGLYRAGDVFEPIYKYTEDGYCTNEAEPIIDFGHKRYKFHHWLLLEHPSFSKKRAGHIIIDKGITFWSKEETKRIAHIYLSYYAEELTYKEAIEKATAIVKRFNEKYL